MVLPLVSLLSVSSSGLLILSFPRVPWNKQPSPPLWGSSFLAAVNHNLGPAYQFGSPRRRSFLVGFSGPTSQWPPKVNLCQWQPSQPTMALFSESTYGDAHALASGENLQRFLVQRVFSSWTSKLRSRGGMFPEASLTHSFGEGPFRHTSLRGRTRGALPTSTHWHCSVRAEINYLSRTVFQSVFQSLTEFSCMSKSSGRGCIS